MTDTISSETLYQAILNGAARTRERRDDLNRINVFPVVDNDTGTNLAHTMQYILRHSRFQGNVRATLKDIARTAVMGARGNSGAIFSQYFNGLSQSSSDTATVTLSELATCFHNAYDKAFKAIENPVEGTVITLMRAWAVSFQESLAARRTLHELLETSLNRIHLALEETTSTLKMLRSLGIVDAGALGYYYFMDGFVKALLGQHEPIDLTDVQIDLPLSEPDLHLASPDQGLTHRYCTEVLIESPDLDQDSLRSELRPLGDCLLVSTADTLARIHVHTDEPWTVIKIAAQRGQILEQKADDMVWQNLLAGPAESKIACVTDSIADLPSEFIFQHHVFQIPLNVLIGEISFLDKITVDGEYLSQHIREASSAQLNTAQILEFLRPILAHYDQVLILTVSSQMSGTYSRFKDALAELEPDLKAGRIALIDSKVNSGAQGLLVREAVRLIESGMSLPQLITAIEACKTRAKIVVSVLDIEPMARSGRVSERIGDLLVRLKFKPLVTINPEGKGTIKGLAFSTARNWKILIRSLRRQSIGDYVIVHAGAPERAAAIESEMIRITGRPPVYITAISAIVTLFAGQGSIAVAYLEPESQSVSL